MEALDFEVEIGEGSGGHYPVSVIRSPAGEGEGVLTFPYDSLALENRLQALQIALLSGRGAGPSRRITPESERPVQEFGTALFDSLFVGEIRSLYEVSRREAQKGGGGLRLKLRFECADLASLPWEFIYDTRRAEYVCLSTATPLVRYLELPQAVSPLTVEPPLKVLAMVASPNDLEALDVENEKQRMTVATQELSDSGLLDLHWLAGQTWRDLQRALRTDSWHVFHFIGHGGFDPETGEGVLALATDDGSRHLLPATSLGRLLGDHFPLRLAVLNSCEGARADKADVFSSTAAVLVRRGTPAVVAMQYAVTDRAAIELSRSFYEAIADGMPVDEALTEARKSVSFGLPGSVEWGTPVLYMRAPDGVLFDVARAVVRPRPAPKPSPASPQISRVEAFTPMPKPAPRAAPPPPPRPSPPPPPPPPPPPTWTPPPPARTSAKASSGNAWKIAVAIVGVLILLGIISSAMDSGSSGGGGGGGTDTEFQCFDDDGDGFDDFNGFPC